MAGAQAGVGADWTPRSWTRLEGHKTKTRSTNLSTAPPSPCSHVSLSLLLHVLSLFSHGGLQNVAMRCRGVEVGEEEEEGITGGVEPNADPLNTEYSLAPLAQLWPWHQLLQPHRGWH